MVSKKSRKEVRFQDCPLYIKAWRYRYYLWIPVDALKIWLATKSSLDLPLTWGNAWTVAAGLAQGKMLWYYEWAEVKSGLEDKINILKRDD